MAAGAVADARPRPDAASVAAWPVDFVCVLGAIDDDPYAIRSTAAQLAWARQATAQLRPSFEGVVACWQDELATRRSASGVLELELVVGRSGVAQPRRVHRKHPGPAACAEELPGSTTVAVPARAETIVCRLTVDAGPWDATSTLTETDPILRVTRTGTKFRGRRIAAGPEKYSDPPPRLVLQVDDDVGMARLDAALESVQDYDLVYSARRDGRWRALPLTSTSGEAMPFITARTTMLTYLDEGVEIGDLSGTRPVEPGKLSEELIAWRMTMANPLAASVNLASSQLVWRDVYALLELLGSVGFRSARIGVAPLALDPSLRR